VARARGRGCGPHPLPLALATPLQGNGLTRAGVALALQSSREGLQRQVQGLFQSLLLRPARPAGRAGCVAFLQAGGRLEDLIAGLLASAECAALAG
jgi:hypothetical protein